MRQLPRFKVVEKEKRGVIERGMSVISAEFQEKQRQTDEKRRHTGDIYIRIRSSH
jgi:hypothetical protein